MISDDVRRVYVISFDFKQPKGADQARKTRFFREMYGYTQQVKQQLRDGEIVVRRYHYPGVLDQFPYIKLGKSVIAVHPGNEGTIIKLLRAFDEVVFYNFIGWLPISLWPITNGDETSRASSLIATYGYHSILLQIQNMGNTTKDSNLLDAGFNMDYISKAVHYLTTKKLLIKTENKLTLTSKGKQIVSQVS